MAFLCIVFVVSAFLYALTFAPFGRANPESRSESPENLTVSITPLYKAEGVAIEAVFDFGQDSPAISPVNGIKALPSPVNAAQPADYFPYTVISTEKSGNFIYYCQKWEAYTDIPYGSETIGTYGCGPVNVAMVVSTLTNKRINPVEVTALAVKWNLFVAGSGTAHSIFPKSADYYGVRMEEFTSTKESIVEKLKAGRLLICSMGEGYFSRSGHFLTLRGITPEGKILIADSNSPENTQKEWDLDYLFSQLRYRKMWAFYV